ncbi:MAG TPA: ABC transporter ATP-binding protein [Acidimicrobiia bacterium]|nr:ABC transporter ATP-binding protein [Acidimicrobiia bacterium]
MTSRLAETSEISKRFVDNLAVDGVSISIRAGEIVGLVGANGAGKTTFIRVLLGLLRPDRGQVILFGETPTRATRHRLGYMPQGMGLYEDLTVSQNLDFTARVFGVEPPALEGDLAALGDTLVADVPLGLRRRTGFLAALSHRPDLLVLDEPTSGVGPLGRAELWETIHDAADAGAGILVTTHHMDEAEQCDRLVLLSAGRAVASGTVDEILAGQTTIEIAPADPAAALATLGQAGLPVLPTGPHLRLPGVTIDSVRSILGGDVGLTESRSTLEEAFMSLARGV